MVSALRMKIRGVGRRFFTTGEAETADAGNVAFYPAAGCRYGFDGHVYYSWVGVLQLVGLSVLCHVTVQGLPEHELQAG